MLQVFRRIYALLDTHERRRAYVLLGLVLVMGALEMVGVASIMPFMAVLSDPAVISENRYLAYTYESLGFGSDRAFLAFLGVVIFAVLVTTLSVSAFTQWFLFRFSQMCNYRISSRLLAAYLRRPYVWFLRQHSSDLGRSVLSEVNELVSKAILPSVNVLARGVVTLFLLALVVAVDPAIALLAALVLGGAYGLLYLAVRRRLVHIGGAMIEANQERFKLAQESLGGFKDVKVTGLESVYAERFLDPARRHAKYLASHQIMSALPKFLLEALAFGGIIAIAVALLMTRDEGIGGALPVLSLYAFAGYRLMPALQQLYANVAALKFGTRVLERVHGELMEASGSQQAESDSGSEGPLALHERLALERISYRYPGARENALSGVSLEIPARHSVGFVGATGAGKTTIVDLILGLLEPDEGRLVVDGVEIGGDNVRRWQKTVGYVPQHIFLIDDSVTANIAFGIPPEQVDRAAVERASRIAELHEFVMHHLPEGYETKVGERGVRLSGGQRQRIGIARALYRDPSVLVLDEATSALDNLTEHAVMSAVNNLGHEKTIIMIAHRLSTVASCDRIFLMAHGKVVAAGTYEELTRSSPEFRAMAVGAGN